MTDRRTAIITALESGLKRTVTFFSAMDPQDLEVQVYQDGAGWTARQVLAHFVTIEKSMHWLFRNILQGGPGSPRDFDIDRFNRNQPAQYDGYSISALLEQFEATRKETIEIARTMSDSDLDRQGWHVFHGQGRLERFIHWAHEHAQLHENDIRAVLDEKYRPNQ